MGGLCGIAGPGFELAQLEPAEWADLVAGDAVESNLLLQPRDFDVEEFGSGLDVHERLHLSSPPWDSMSRRSTLPLVVPRNRHGITEGENK